MTGAILSLLWLAASPAQTPPAAQPASAPAKPAAAGATAPAAAPAKPSATAAAPAGAAAQPAPADASAPAQAAAPVAPANADQIMDRGLELLHGGDLERGAAVLYGLYAALPETDLRRDAAAFALARALVDLGFIQAGIEYYLEILSGRRSPELFGKSLAALKPLYERGLVEEWRFLDGVVYMAQYGDLEPEVADFVEYLQAMGDLRLGFSGWGKSRLEALAATERVYGWRARYLLAVERIKQRADEGAEKLLRQILDAAAAPPEVRTLAALALARVLYEQKNYDEAFTYYSQVRLPLVEQDLVMLERAWDRVGAEDQQRALGMMVGLGAPIYRRVFAPERDLIRALALRRLCQYRLAHHAVRDFHERYGALVRKARERSGLREDPQFVDWASWGTRLASQARMRTRMHTEVALIDHVSDGRLEEHLRKLYAARLAFTEGQIRRGLDRALDRVVDELLRVSEQMDLIDYEISAGLVKPGSKQGSAKLTARSGATPYGTPQVFFRFDGEYWSDELGDFSVLADDRCLR